jgi:hypothetical protein
MYACTVTCSIEGRNDKSSVHLEREESVIFGKKIFEMKIHTRCTKVTVSGT